MRTICAFFSCLLLAGAWAQEPGPSADAAGGQQIVVLIREHSMGPEILEVSAVSPDYPESLMRKQIEAFGKELGSEPRGLAVYTVELVPGDPKMRFLKASFAVDDLVKDGEILLTPLIRAFAGAPEPHTVHGMRLVLEGIEPSAATVKDFESAAVKVAGRFDKNPTMIEYEIQLKTQNPGEITVASRPPSQEQPKQAGSESPGISSVVVWTLVLLAGLGVGALVYSVLIRRQVPRAG